VKLIEMDRIHAVAIRSFYYRPRNKREIGIADIRSGESQAVFAA
jgi:hypothetical protein